MLTAISHVEQIVHQLTFGDNHYGVTFAQDRIGVVRNGCGKVKYMPVTWDYNAHGFPRMLKTRLPYSGTAESLVETLVACSWLHASPAQCIELCERILAHGRTPR